MSEPKPTQKGSVLSNLDASADAPQPPTTPPNPRSVSPEDKMTLSDSKETIDALASSKDAEPEAKKRKRSQRACIRCRGQKLKCDGVFPCARCLKLKLVCKEPSETNAGTPSSNRVNSDDRDAKAHTASYTSSIVAHPYSHANSQLTPSGIPSHGPALPPYSSSRPDGVNSDRPRFLSHSHLGPQHREAMSHHPSDRFGYSLPDAVRRIDLLERTVSRLVDRVEGHPAPLERSNHYQSGRPTSSRSAASPQKPERKRARADSPDDSDAEVDELQDGASEASVPLQALSHHQRRTSREELNGEAEHSAPPRSSHGVAASQPPALALAQHESAWTNSNGARHTPICDPIDAGFITIELGQVLLEFFLTYCHVFAPFLELDDKVSVSSLAATEPFLLSVLLAIGSLYHDSHGKNSPTVRAETHAGLASYALSQMGSQVCSSDPTIGSVQAILLIAYWPQAFPGCPDEKSLSGYASNLLQSVARRTQISTINGERTPPSHPHRLSSVWTCSRAFEALAAIDTGKGMELSDHDLALSKAPRPSRSSIPTPYLVRVLPIVKELQVWLGEVSSNSPLAALEAAPPAPRPNLTHDWDRFKYLQSQLFDVEKRWLSAETDCSRLERIVGLVDRWTLQIYLASIALRSAEMGRPSKAHASERGPAYDMRYDEESARFVAAYRHEIRQACQVLLDIFTDPEISGALLYAPGYLLRRFGYAATAAAVLVDYHDAELTRSTQELIYLCSKRFEQISQLDSSTFASNLAWFVKSSYEKIGGQTNRDEHDSGMASAAHASVTVADRRRWLGGDVFSIFFGVGVLLDAATGQVDF